MYIIIQTTVVNVVKKVNLWIKLMTHEYVLSLKKILPVTNVFPCFIGLVCPVVQNHMLPYGKQR